MTSTDTIAMDLRVRMIEYGLDPATCADLLSKMAHTSRDYFELTKEFIPVEERNERRNAVIQLELLLSIFNGSNSA